MALPHASKLLPRELYLACLPYVKCRKVYFDSPRKEEWEVKKVRVRVMYGQGITQAAIRRRLHISDPTVRKILREAGLIPPHVKKDNTLLNR